MKHIKLTQGAFRYRPESEKSAVVVRLGDPPFDVPDATAERLVALGVAEYAEEAVATAVPLTHEEKTSEPQDEMQEAAGSELTALEDVPEYSDRMTVKQLKTLMDEVGAEYTDKMSKSDLIKRLDCFFEEAPTFEAEMPL